MKTIHTHIYGEILKKIFFGATLGAILALVFFQNSAFAGLAESAREYAWGGGVTPNHAGYEGIGWISFNSLNCDADKNGFVDSANNCGGDNATDIVVNYGVNIPIANDDLSGQAWSEHYGWISFDGDDLAGCSPTLAQATRVGNTITGGARILAIRDAVLSSNAGGYNGCISLSGTATNGSTYGVTIAGNNLSGYGWSSDLGWIDFNGVTIDFPECSDGINNDGDGNTDYNVDPLLGDPDCDHPTDDTEGGGSIPCPLKTENNCRLPISSTGGLIEGECVGTHNGDSYKGTCSQMCDTTTGTWGAPTTNECYAGNITANPNSLPLNDKSTLSWEVTPAVGSSASCWVEGTNGDGGDASDVGWYNVPSNNTPPRETVLSSALVSDTTYTLACGTEDNLLDSVPVDVSGPDVSANPLIVDIGKTSTITWKPKGLLCTVKKGGTNLPGAIGVSVQGSADVIISAQTTFTLNCTDPAVPGPSFADTVTVNITGWQAGT